MRANHAKAYLSQQFAQIEVEWRWFIQPRFEIIDDDLLDEEIEALTSLIDSCPSGNKEELTSIVPKIISQIGKIIDTLEQTPSKFAGEKRKKI